MIRRLQNSRPRRRSARGRSTTFAVGLALVWTFLFPSGVPAAQTHVVRAGSDAARELQDLLILAGPGDTIQLEDGVFTIARELSVSTDHITIRGRGREKTVLSFKSQTSGDAGIDATGNAFVVEDLAIEDTPGNGIRATGSDGVTFRRVRVEWTAGPRSSNGAYGLYPVLCRNVLIDQCVAIGASDAGIYVGQSNRVVVRRSRAERNVAGIEIENTYDADVYDNLATQNTGGILVFDLPGLQQTNGGRVRLFKNRVIANNHDNFAPPGNIVGTVSPGTGVMVMATSDVEVFANTIEGNSTFSIAVFSYHITGKRVADSEFNAYPTRVHVHENVIRDGGAAPRGNDLEPLVAALGKPFPAIVYDGITDAQRKSSSGPAVVLGDNGSADFVNLRYPEFASGHVRFDRDRDRYKGSLSPLLAVELKPHPEPPQRMDPAIEVFQNAPKKLSEYALFHGTGATQKPVDGVVPYDLNTALFSDHTAKYRFVRLPKGTAATYHSDKVFEFPVGTVIAKTFAEARAAPAGGATTAGPGRLIETRILTHEPSGWHGFSYVWNVEQTEATLRLGGAELVVESSSDGERVLYEVPNANQCRDCHVTDVSRRETLPLGVRARNINKSFAYADSQRNQLDEWSRRGILRGAPDSASAPRVAQATVVRSGSVEERARAWLDVNCAHCHNPAGGARASGLDLSFSQQDSAKLGVWKAPVAAGRGAGKRRYGIVPGKPEESILTYRLESTEPGVVMPPLGRRQVDPVGVSLIRDWIASMPREGDDLEDPPKRDDGVEREDTEER